MDQTWKLRRRTMLSSAATLLVASTTPALAGTNGTTRPPTSPIPTKPTRQLRLDEFMELSKFATTHQDLDPKTGSLILTSLSLDPRFRDQLVPLYEQVRKSVAEGSTDPMDFVLRHNLSRDIFREVISCWYLGTRWVDGRPILFGYFDALMFRAVDGIRNIPATCGGALNYWSEPPQV